MAITERYVSSSGTDTYANSTSASTPMSLSTAVTNATAGDRINIKADGTYTRTATDTMAGAGTTTSPLIWRGYTTTIGDATVGRSADGTLNTANMPLIAYNADFQMTQTGANQIFEALNITGNIAGNLLNIGTSGGHCINCKVSNTSTGGSIAIRLQGTNRTAAINCDASLGASGGNSAIRIDTATGAVIGCRATAIGAIGISVQGGQVVAGNTVFSCGGDGIQWAASAGTFIIANTVYGCTGDAFDINASNTASVFLIGNRFTDNTGKGLNRNSATCAITQCFNRFVNNATNDASDWIDGTAQRNVTTAAAAGADYTSAAGANFSLVAAAAGTSGSFSHLNDIGANGTPVVTGGGGAASFAVLGG